MSTAASRAALGALGLIVGAAAVFALRAATLSTHQPVPPRSRTAVVVQAWTHGGEHNQTLAEMVEAVLLSCRLEVTSDFDGAIRDLGDGRFAGVLVPALSTTNRRQFRGCVEDWTLDQVRVDVIRLESDI
jgi:hypothetical protein